MAEGDVPSLKLPTFTLGKEELFLLYIGLNAREIPKNKWKATVSLLDKVDSHKQKKDEVEGFYNSAIIVMENAELDIAKELVSWFGEKGIRGSSAKVAMELEEKLNA